MWLCRVNLTPQASSSEPDTVSGVDVLAIASEWSYRDRPPDPSVHRTVALPKELRPGVALVVQGVRRAGKSTLLGQLIERVAARSARPLLQLVQMLFESAGSEMSVRRAAATIGMAVDTTSLSINAAETACLAFGCPYFAWSERTRSRRNRKYHPIDTGLRRVSVTATGDDRQRHLECAVFLLLRRRCGRVSYWRDRAEVDFVVEHEGKAKPVQVTWEEPSERHHRALDDFHAQHPQAGEAVFITAESFERGVPELREPES